MLADEKNKVKKICFTASSGGHFEQLMMLKPLMDQHDSFIITEKTAYNTKSQDLNMMYLTQINRKELTFILKFMYNVLKTFIIIVKEKPDVVISTGALVTIPVCLIAKLFKRKVIFIESFAKIKTPTLTGKLMYKFADQFYVQWKDMLDVYPNAIYKGGIY